MYKIMFSIILLLTLVVGMARAMTLNCPTRLTKVDCPSGIPMAYCYRGNLTEDIVLYSDPIVNFKSSLSLRTATGLLQLTNETFPAVYCRYKIDNQEVYLYAFAVENQALHKLFESYGVATTCPDSIASYLRLKKDVKINCGATCTLHAVGSCPSK